ncbi:MAG: hypothetical protein H6577_12005 [Lewinellaceae bacterium]|nr:hypothetical protein [Lewinellaceae bacterium]
MKKTHFLCLANSRKYGERCIAGIELSPDSLGRFHFVKENERPKWIRPVSWHDHGQVPAEWVKHIRVGDILELVPVRACPKGYQTENVLFVKDSLRVVRRADLSVAHLEQLAEEEGSGILGNREKYASEPEVAHFSRSLVLIKAADPHAYFCTPYNTKPRLHFHHGGVPYDLPMTDVDFFNRMQEDPAPLEGKEAVFITVSLGICFEGKYYKLAAGVLAV